MSICSDYSLEAPRSVPGKLVVSAKPIEIEADLTPFRAVAGRDQFLSGAEEVLSGLVFLQDLCDELEFRFSVASWW